MTTFCVFGEHCSVYDPHMKLPGLATSLPVCHGCVTLALSTANLLRYDYIDLSQLIPKPDVHSDTKISRPKPESSPPMAMWAFHLRGEIVHLARTAERELRVFADDARGHLPLLPVREGYALDIAVRYLCSRMEKLAQMPATEAHWDSDDPYPSTLTGPQVMIYIDALHRRSRRMCGLDSRTIFVPGECPTCSVTSLRRTEDDSDRIWCVHCRATFTGSEYMTSVQRRFVEHYP